MRYFPQTRMSGTGLDSSQDMQRDNQRLTDAYKNIFDSPDGEIVLNDLARESGFMQSLHVKNDPTETMVNIGKRDLFLYIMGRMGDK